MHYMGWDGGAGSVGGERSCLRALSVVGLAIHSLY